MTTARKSRRKQELDTTRHEFATNVRHFLKLTQLIKHGFHPCWTDERGDLSMRYLGLLLFSNSQQSTHLSRCSFTGAKISKLARRSWYKSRNLLKSERQWLNVLTLRMKECQHRYWRNSIVRVSKIYRRTAVNKRKSLNSRGVHFRQVRNSVRCFWFYRIFSDFCEIWP